jgi:pimeloyl-ACP methyl ester carboxylesterase
MTILGREFGYLQVHPGLPEERRSDREVILLLHGLGGSSGDWNSPQWRSYEYDHQHEPANRHDNNNLTPPVNHLPDVSLSDKREIRCWSGILRGLGHTVIHYSQEGEQDIAEVPLGQLENLIVPYIRETVLQGSLAGKQVTVIAHSRGGILIRYYLARNPEEGTEWIGRVITLHSPHTGTDAPHAKQRMARWVVARVLGGDLVLWSTGELILFLLNQLTDWLDPPAGQSQLLPGDPLFGRLSLPVDTPAIEFHTFGGSSVTMSRVYFWEWTPGSYVPNFWDFPDIRFDWTKFPIEVFPVSPLVDVIPDEVVFAEERAGQGDIAVTVESSQLPDVEHRTLPINHAEALFDEELFAAVAELLGTPLGSTAAVGCTVGWLGNRRSMELHSLEHRTRQCQIDEIVERAFFDLPQVAFDSGYDGCFYCMRADSRR